jgi:uncharacterized Tic20 family protein
MSTEVPTTPQAPEAPVPPAPVGSPSKDEKTWGLLSHLSGIFLGLVGPLIIWMIKKEEMPFVNQEAKEALNFQITLAIGYVAAGILGHSLHISSLLYPALGICNLVFSIMGAMKANEGTAYAYPFSLKLVK